METTKQKEAHLKRVHECLISRRAGVVSEIGTQKAQLERSKRQAGIDPVFGKPEIAQRCAERIEELQKELTEIDDRLLSGA